MLGVIRETGWQSVSPVAAPRGTRFWAVSTLPTSDFLSTVNELVHLRESEVTTFGGVAAYDASGWLTV